MIHTMENNNNIINWIAAKKVSIVYWIATLWLSLGMFSTGMVQLLKEQTTVDLMLQMGYPEYFLPMLGAAKIAGVLVILIPGYPLVKEWAYAGFFFVIAGATYTYIAVNNFHDLYHLALLLVLLALSWRLRPQSRKVKLS